MLPFLSAVYPLERWEAAFRRARRAGCLQGAHEDVVEHVSPAQGHQSDAAQAHRHLFPHRGERRRFHLPALARLAAGQRLRRLLRRHAVRDHAHDRSRRTGDSRALQLVHYPGPHPILLTLLTSMFIHGGLAHLGGNMLFLWIFGNNVEDILGPRQVRPLLSRCAGSPRTRSTSPPNPASTIPTVGASGAISGLLGAYLIAFPRARVLTLVFLGFFVRMAVRPRVRHHHLLVRHPVHLRARLPRRHGGGRRGVVRARRRIPRRHRAHLRDGGKTISLAPAEAARSISDGGRAVAARPAQSGAGMPSRPSADASRCAVSPKDLQPRLEIENDRRDRGVREREAPEIVDVHPEEVRQVDADDAAVRDDRHVSAVGRGDDRVHERHDALPERGRDPRRPRACTVEGLRYQASSFSGISARRSPMSLPSHSPRDSSLISSEILMRYVVAEREPRRLERALGVARIDGLERERPEALPEEPRLRSSPSGSAAPARHVPCTRRSLFQGDSACRMRYIFRGGECRRDFHFAISHWLANFAALRYLLPSMSEARPPPRAMIFRQPERYPGGHA